jgi:hypothetical protein
VLSTVIIRPTPLPFIMKLPAKREKPSAEAMGH